MSEISASAVASLRSRTGVSILECKKALEEAGGDEEAAIDILRSKGAASAAKKADRDQGEGYIFSAQGSGKSALVALHCETDFVARSDDFQSFGSQIANMALEQGADGLAAEAEETISAAVQKLGENITLGEVQVVEGAVVGTYVHTNGKIATVITLNDGSEDKARDAAMHAAAMQPGFVSPDEVTQEEVDKEKEIWKQQLADEGKPAEIMEKIMIGKEKKFREENALLTQQFVKNPEVTVQQHLDGAEVTEYVRMTV